MTPLQQDRLVYGVLLLVYITSTFTLLPVMLYDVEAVEVFRWMTLTMTLFMTGYTLCWVCGEFRGRPITRSPDV